MVMKLIEPVRSMSLLEANILSEPINIMLQELCQCQSQMRDHSRIT